MNPPTPAPTNLVLSGGGLKGLSFCGVFKALEETNLRNGIKNVCTVSIGAIMGLLFILQYSSDEIRDIIINKDFSTFINLRFTNIFTKYGCDKGTNIVKWMQEVLARKGLHPDITFKQLYENYAVVYTVCATNLNTFSPTFFNVHTAPDMPVVKAIRMSISVPLVFTPVLFDNHFFIDGSVSDNFPLDFFEDDLPNTLGVKLVSNGELEESNQQINTFFSFITNCISCMIVNKDKLAIKPRQPINNNSALVMYIRTEHFDKYFLDFKLSNEVKSQMIDLGYTYAKDILTPEK